MAKFRNVQEALLAIDDDAAYSALKYLEREAPKTVTAIQYLVFDAKWNKDNIIDYFDEKYGTTEEKKMHKVKLLIETLLSDREEQGQ